MKRLNGVDALMLYSETPEIHMHTLKVGVLDISEVAGGYSHEFVRKVAAPRLLALPPLRRQLVEIPGRLHHPMWVENPTIDFDYHLRFVEVPAPGGRRELDELIGRIASTPLDRSKPLWEMYVVEGLTGDRVAIVHKVHHVLADGVASANQMSRVISPQGPVGCEDDSTGHTAHSPAQLLRAAGEDHLRQIRRLPALVRDTAAGVSQVYRKGRERGAQPDLARNFAPPRTFLNHVVTPARRFATAPVALADAKLLARTLGVTLNDIVLATAAGALRELQLRYDGRADAPLIAGVPIAFNTSPDRLSGNEFSYMTPSLAVHVEDPLERVRLTSVATQIAKENHHLLGPTVIASWLNYLPPRLVPPVFRWQSQRRESSMIMNLTISNVPGPRELGLVAGASVDEIYSVGPLVVGSGMNITVWSYVDQLSISVLTDDQTLDDPHEATHAMVRSFAELRAAAGITGPLTDVPAALPFAGAAP
ncbi:WS/DGAT/MGAT family O-acyltransferase [Mycolicibacterium litorale]|uniref:Diacylglycerol O-acyltransferase n=1 Tax=Mycolicibacterium litorale TaxID=758802 RepID=A0AAD1INA4_9MYCO|nr:wax ester/triacylglycerol synthase family O-acyltransferase [Mycolicibacterium litorale]MCV7415447.1 wax ester/triacylglycerol synthase family O-acyltransferase [Mycolicibacterium litorale]TDY08702.1 diacylglycerol O-acyltransferase [Mycolicibacterium litorale]BBY16627.1 diacylglycerol O-acyltransferase [Mycolicibacterium litorale]